MASAHKPGKSRSLYAELIKVINDMVDSSIISAGDTITQALVKLVVERDNQ